MKTKTIVAAPKCEAKMLPTAELAGAKWNTHAKEKKTDEAFKGLVASIKAQGIIQRLAVRKTKDGYEIIDGHRRTAAALAAGLVEVPCDVYESMDDGDAQVRTVTANVQRLENDPIKEAEAYELMMKDGKTQKEIAAILGKSEQYVARRKRLIALIPEWRETIKKSEDVVSVSFLESLAAYEPDAQRAAHEAFDNDQTGDDEDGIIEWLRNMTMKISEAKFCTNDCANCPHNTANKSVLFAGMFDDEDARCENRPCFDRKTNEAADEAIAKIKSSGVDVKEFRSKWEAPNGYDAKPQKDKKHTVPFVTNVGGVKTVWWAEPKKDEPKTAAKSATTKAEAEAEKKRKAEHLAWFRAQRSAKEKAYAVFHANGAKTSIEKIVRECVGNPRFNEWVVGYLLKYGPLSQTWSDNDQNVALIGMAGTDMLRDFGLDFSEDEAKAIMSEDPNNAK